MVICNFAVISFPYLGGSITTITDNRSFLFTLVNPSGTKPLKIGPIPEASGGIRCQRDLGPTFGSDKNFDLRVHQKDNLGYFVGDLNLGNGFTCPQKAEKRTFFTGKSPFEISVLEVFLIDF